MVVAMGVAESIAASETCAIPSAIGRKLKAMSLLLIMLVVLVHSVTTDVKSSGLDASIRPISSAFLVQEFVANGIARSAVPLFFAISGYLFFHNLPFGFAQFVPKWKRRFRSLVIPYLLWSGLGIAMFSCLQMLPWTHRLNSSAGQYQHHQHAGHRTARAVAIHTASLSPLVSP